MVDEITESAKAVQEVAKTTGTGLNVAEKAGAFFAKVMGEPIDAAAGMIADTLRYKAWKNQAKLIDEIEVIIKQRALEGKTIPVPPKFALPLFQAASVEDDDYMHKLWVKLLASAMDPVTSTHRTAFIEIIKQLTPDDVKIINQAYDVYLREVASYKEFCKREKKEPMILPPNRYEIKTYSLVNRMDSKGREEYKFWESLDNLFRLGLAASYFNEEVEGFDEEKDSLINFNSLHGGYDNIYITAIGIKFVQICRYGEDDKIKP